MLKMVTFFQGLPGQQQSVLGTLDFPGSPQKSQSASEVESEASMSEASSEDMMPSQETGMAPDEEEEESTKKEKKKYKGLANMFSVFTKGKKKKKKNQPRSSDPEVQPKPRPELDGPPPTVEELKEALENGRLEAAWPVLALERELEAAAAAGPFPSGFVSYQRTFDEFLEKSKLLRNYRANIMANINNCLSFGTSMEQKWQIPQESLRHLLDPLKDLRAHGFDALLQGLFAELKPLFKKFTQTRWATPVETLEEIISTVDVSLPEFSELKDCFREGSPATWLHQALPKLAEIIRLQDSSAIKIEVATYATLYPDFSKGHLNAILAIKGNLPSSEVRSIRNILDINTGLQEPSRPLFALIKHPCQTAPNCYDYSSGGSNVFFNPLAPAQTHT
ncbi:tumor necrosis factor alpha-induced protein 2 [Cricetulus griseus]|uniref:Tumor necrosis factor alpha-induced protein 2 n=1 Tax=Cricetulus griseus TaxID=10029 RepID=A0A061HYS3_CRIGR|nr:tumor necrosis factor alpha-induced protein 2 [Cricetulus griseus]